MTSRRDDYDRNYDYLDYPEVKLYRSRLIHRARVAHICDYCKEIIPVGQSYVREFWVVDGERPTMTVHHAGELGMCPKDIAQIEADFEAEQKHWAKFEQELDELY